MLDAFSAAQEIYFAEIGPVAKCAGGAFERESLNSRKRLINKFLCVPSLVLEVGPGSGTVLQWAVREGHIVAAVEHSQALARYLVEEFGLAVWAGEFESFDLQSNSFDAFFSFHVIEHVPDPIAHMRKAFSVVRAGGLAFVATPNSRSWQQRLFETLSPNFDSAHLRVFSPDSLRRVCEAAGWTLVAAYTPEHTTGWLRVATKWFRRLKREDEEATAGMYAGSRSFAFAVAFWAARVLSYPFRTLQSGLGGGNELLFVFAKPK